MHIGAGKRERPGFGRAEAFKIDLVGSTTDEDTPNILSLSLIIKKKRRLYYKP